MAAAATAVRKNKEKKAANTLALDEDVTAVFAKYDADGSGDVDRKELGSALAQLGITASEQEISKIMAKFDSGEGDAASLDIEEFGELVSAIRAGGTKRAPPPSPDSASSLKRAASRRASAMVAPVVTPVSRACNPQCTLPYQDKVREVYNHGLVVTMVAGCIVANFLVNIIEKEIDPSATLYTQLWLDLDLAFNIIFLVFIFH